MACSLFILATYIAGAWQERYFMRSNNDPNLTHYRAVRLPYSHSAPFWESLSQPQPQRLKPLCSMRCAARLKSCPPESHLRGTTKSRALPKAICAARLKSCPPESHRHLDEKSRALSWRSLGPTASCVAKPTSYLLTISS